MNPSPGTVTGLLFCLCAIIFNGCETSGPDTRTGSHRSGRYPSTWTDVDQWDRKWPAYAFARHGMLEEARAAVERGDDTQAHYDQGERYYNYWKLHSASVETGVTSSEVMRDMTNDLLNSNANQIDHIKRKAAAGDPEAQEWLRRNGWVETGNNAARQMNRE